jgi:hypothetical protein
MRTLWAARAALVGLVCALAAFAALVHPAAAGSSSATAAPAAPQSQVAGTVSTRVVVNRFRAIGRKVVGLGTSTTTYTDAKGVKRVRQKHFWMSIRSHRAAQQSSAVCQILFLEIGEVDLTLAGSGCRPTMPEGSSAGSSASSPRHRPRWRRTRRRSAPPG